eukprot:2187712-Rhodomonas_salina.1
MMVRRLLESTKPSAHSAHPDALPRPPRVKSPERCGRQQPCQGSGQREREEMERKVMAASGGGVAEKRGFRSGGKGVWQNLLRRVMTTGMSPPPTPAVTRNPSTPGGQHAGSVPGMGQIGCQYQG